MEKNKNRRKKYRHERKPSSFSPQLHEQPEKNMKTIYLASLRRMNGETVSRMGMKSIIRVSTPRLVTWYLVLPAVGDSDCKCMMLEKVKKTHASFSALDRIEACIIRDEKARAAARIA
jgi:hypothetical protein